MNEEQRRSVQSNKQKPSINWWKWAFITLSILIVGCFAFLFTSIQSKSINEPNLDPIEQIDDEFILETSLEKKDVEQFINMYFTAINEDESTNYTVELTNQLQINGDIDILNFDVPFKLFLDPYVLENGNIQLRASSLKLASFSLPISAVMSLLADQIEVPYFIAFDASEEVIVINLNELKEKTDIGIEMKKIDLENDVINLNLHVNNQDLLNQIILDSTNN